MNTENIEAYLSGELPEDLCPSVETALRHDRALREVYLRQHRMDAVLRLLYSGTAEVSKSAFTRAVMARLSSEGAGPGNSREFSKSVLTEILEEREKIVPRWWPDLLKAAAIALLASALTVSGLRMVNIDPTVPEEPTLSEEEKREALFLARIQSTRDAVLAGEHALREDGWIPAGLLEVKEGLAEIAFNSGARAFVEGPARLNIASENRVFLESGSLTAEVSPRAAGFTVNTPRMNVVDIGTRFGVRVCPEGETEVHVLEGIVEASRSSGHAVSVILREGLALRADSRPLSALVPIPYGGDQFALTTVPGREPVPVIEYLFDESGGSAALDSGSGLHGGPYDLDLLEGNSFDDSPRRAPGARGGGLVFSQGQQVSTPLPQVFRLENPFTIAFWLKIPPEIGRTIDDYVIGWGREGTGWEFGCRNAPGGGNLIAAKDGHVLTGTTDLADGKWHHIAVRFIGGDSADLGTHLHLYVDGTPETLLGKPGSTLEGGRVGELRIGDLRNSGFLGWIDQVTIFDGAISTSAIQDLMEEPSQNSAEN